MSTLAMAVKSQLAVKPIIPQAFLRRLIKEMGTTPISKRSKTIVCPSVRQILMTTMKSLWNIAGRVKQYQVSSWPNSLTGRPPSCPNRSNPDCQALDESRWTSSPKSTSIR
uniref:Uncharacterized protein n=1 Tax=Romanomermis culicivorax TaxID=13658 RepID=A0A915L342_ROMCU